MLGAIILAVVIIVVIPVGFLMTMAIVSAVMGWALTDDAEARADSTLIANRKTAGGRGRRR